MESALDTAEARALADQRFKEGLDEAERFFMGEARVQEALARICAELQAAGIPYAVAGAMALNAHGFQRVTTDVGLLLTREGLAALKERVLGRGWVEKFPGSKGLKDAKLGVTIDILIAGEYPGDGRPKAVVFPDPATLEAGSPIRHLPLEKLIELKLASGSSAAHRSKDLSDIQELIKAAKLPPTLGHRLDPSVRSKYAELWELAQIYDPISER